MDAFYTSVEQRDNPELRTSWLPAQFVAGATSSSGRMSHPMMAGAPWHLGAFNRSGREQVEGGVIVFSRYSRMADD